MRIVLVDLDESALKSAEAELQNLCAVDSILAVPADVSSVASMQQVRDEAWRRFGACHFLFLNAGIGGGGGPWTGLEKWRTLVDVNLFGVLHGLHAFVPAMLEAKEPGVIAITGSREGITTPPIDICYNVTKAGVRVLAEGLEHKLRSQKGSKLSSRLLLPGVTATPIMYNTTRRVRGNEAADAQLAKMGGKKDEMMSKMMRRGAAISPDVVAGLLTDSVDTGGPFYVICPGSSSIEEFKESYQRHADDLIHQRPPLSQFAKL